MGRAWTQTLVVSKLAAPTVFFHKSNRAPVILRVRRSSMAEPMLCYYGRRVTAN
jgi:hypothetical protein